MRDPPRITCPELYMMHAPCEFAFGLTPVVYTNDSCKPGLASFRCAFEL